MGVSFDHTAEPTKPDIADMKFDCASSTLQFGNQEPASNAVIFKNMKQDYGVQFPMFSKIEVNGPNASPIFKYLKDGTDGRDISWNFEKFLVVDGKVTKRYPDSTSPADILDDIEEGLGLADDEEDGADLIADEHDEE